MAQQSRDLLARGYTTKTNYVLAWNYHTKIVPYDKHNSTPVLYTAPGGSTASAFLAKSMEPFPSLYAN
eukprot:8197387-Ditylum_brightwellii.AAC.1